MIPCSSASTNISEGLAAYIFRVRLEVLPEYMTSQPVRPHALHTHHWENLTTKFTLFLTLAYIVKKQFWLLTLCVLQVTCVPLSRSIFFNKKTQKCHSVKEERQETFFSIKRWQCRRNKASNQPQCKQAQANAYSLLSLTEVLPVSLDSLQADIPRCAMAAYVPHSSHTQIPEDLHIWNTYIRHPRHSSLSGLIPQAMYLGNCSRWWKSWASLSHLQQKDHYGESILRITLCYIILTTVLCSFLDPPVTCNILPPMMTNIF
jgi:hypothetical protein